MTWSIILSLLPLLYRIILIVAIMILSSWKTIIGQSLSNNLGISRMYGSIISEKKQRKNGTVVEKIHIYPQESHTASTTLVREGLLVSHENAKATVLICHGFMCDQYDAGILRGMFKRSHFNVVTFDFRGHGKNNQGQYCTFGRDEALDVIAAAKFLRSCPHLKDKPLIGYGFSMGAVSAIEAQSIDGSLFDALILDCPFESSEKVIKTGLQALKFSILGYEFEVPGKNLLEKYAFHPYIQSLVKTVLRLVSQMDATAMKTNFCPIYPGKSIKKIIIPCFFIHCKNDEKVSVEQVKSIYSSASGWKRLWLTNGRRHCDSAIYNPEEYAQRVREFCRYVIQKEITHVPTEQIFIDEDNDY